MRIRKIADLPEGTIQKRESLIVSRASFDSPCHIVVANAHVRRDSRFANRMDSYAITRCNRILESTLTVDGISDLRLCPRCGDRSDFLEALRQHKTHMEEWLRKNDERIALEKAASDRALKDKQDHTIEILRAHGLCAHLDTTGWHVVFEHAGWLFTVDMQDREEAK